MKTPTAAELLHLAREARERYFALGRAFQVPEARYLRMLDKARARWWRRQAMLERAIQEECERA